MPNKNKHRVKLTAVEQLLVDDFMRAAKALPKSICIKTNDWPTAHVPDLKVFKRTAVNACQQVASLRKKSLIF